MIEQESNVNKEGEEINLLLIMHATDILFIITFNFAYRKKFIKKVWYVFVYLLSIYPAVSAERTLFRKSAVSICMVNY